MAMGNGRATRIGWAGTGRMGIELVKRLLEAGHDVAVYNRTRAKAEPLAELGATVVDTPAELADREIVFTIVAGSEDFKALVLGADGLLSGTVRPRMIVDITTVSPAAGEDVRRQAAELGVALLAAPVSGNPEVVKAGKLTICVSGPGDAWEEARPYLELLARGVTYVGEGERARLVKICHNLMLGVVAECLAEITVLAEKGGVSRADFLAFLNDSVMGSTFTRYKTPAYVNLDFTPTFTPRLLLKDFHLGFEAARALEVSMPVAATTQEIVQAMVGNGYEDIDFAALLEVAAKAAGYAVVSEDVAVGDGLVDPASASPAGG